MKSVVVFFFRGEGLFMLLLMKCYICRTSAHLKIKGSNTVGTGRIFFLVFQRNNSFTNNAIERFTVTGTFLVFCLET